MPEIPEKKCFNLWSSSWLSVQSQFFLFGGSFIQRFIRQVLVKLNVVLKTLSQHNGSIHASEIQCFRVFSLSFLSFCLS